MRYLLIRINYEVMCYNVLFENAVRSRLYGGPHFSVWLFHKRKTRRILRLTCFSSLSAAFDDKLPGNGIATSLSKVLCLTF
jgi:hypothetical protein